MNPPDLVSEFGACIGLAGFTLNENGMARLQLDGRIVVDFELDHALDVLHVYAGIAPVSPGREEAQLRLLMEANLFLDRSAGTTCALDSRAGEYLACLRLETEELDAQGLMRWVERLADAVERLRAELAALEKDFPAATNAVGMEHGVLRG